jgi:rare lipoprotein A
VSISRFPSRCLAVAITACVASAGAIAGDAAPRPDHPAAKGHELDRSGRKQVGKASFYAPMFARPQDGRRHADGSAGRQRRQQDLPLGTKARVTNLETGKSAEVTIQDRGPYVDGRIVDLSPATAEKIGLSRQGLAPVEVAPIAVPLPDGTMRAGVAANDR